MTRLDQRDWLSIAIDVGRGWLAGALMIAGGRWLAAYDRAHDYDTEETP